MKYPLAVAEEPDGLFVVDADDRMVADLGVSDFDIAEDRQHAREIVAACNSHQSLARVAADLANWDGDGGPEIEPRDERIKLGNIVIAAKAALVTARGDTP